MTSSLIISVVAVSLVLRANAQTYYEPDMVDQTQGSNLGAPSGTTQWGQNFIQTMALGENNAVYSGLSVSSATDKLLPGPDNTDSYGESGMLRADFRRNSNPNGRPNTFRFFMAAAGSQNVVYYTSEIGFVTVTEVVDQDTGETQETLSYNSKVNDYMAGSFSDGDGRPTSAAFGAKIVRGGRYDACDNDVFFVSSNDGTNSAGHVSIFAYDTETPLEEVGTMNFKAFIAEGSNPGGFGFDMAYSDAKLAVAAPGDGNGAVYVYSIISTNCVLSGNLESRLTSSGGAPSLFGRGVSFADGDTLVVGSPTESGDAGLPATGVTYVFSGSPLTESQRLYPTAEQFPQTSDGMEMGYDVAARASVWAMAGAPGALSNDGGGYMMRLNATSGQWFIEYFTSRVGVFGFSAGNRREGEIVEHNGCATFMLSARGANAISNTYYDISAFFPDEYCTCSTISLQQTWPRYIETIGDQAVCEKVEKFTYLQCQAGGAGSLCNYKAQTGYRFELPEVANGVDTFNCFKPEGIVRKVWKSNCFYSYNSVGSK